MKKIVSFVLLVSFELLWTATETTSAKPDDPDPFRRERIMKVKSPSPAAVSVKRHAPSPKVRQKMAHRVLSTLRRRVVLVTKLGATVAANQRFSTHATYIGPPYQGGPSLMSTITSGQPTVGGSTPSVVTVITTTTTSGSPSMTSNSNIPTTPISGRSSTRLPTTSSTVGSSLTGTTTVATSTGISGSTSTGAPTSTGSTLTSATVSTSSATTSSSTTTSSTSPTTSTSSVTVSSTSPTSTSPTFTVSSTTATTTAILCTRSSYHQCYTPGNCCVSGLSCRPVSYATFCTNNAYPFSCL